jgi:DNA processing protein
MNRQECHLVLNSIRRIGPVRVRKMVDALGSVEAIFQTPASQLAGIDGIGRAAADEIARWEEHWNLATELARMKELGISFVDREDPAYPPKLREIYDPPLVLYYKGDIRAASRRSVGVIGSRQTTVYGFETAKKLSYQIAYAGLCVVSGLARGIDTAAHMGALAAKGRTAAVFGCSLDLIYPEENRALAERIVESGGVWLSEFPLGTTPDRQTFPMRNRIVSGLSEGVLVVEAGKESGAMITARMALEQGRQVFAVPGRIDNPHAQGCHQLIKEGARLVEGVGDVLHEFEYLFPPQELEKPRVLPADLTPEEKSIMEALDDDEMHLDTLTRKCGLPSSVVSSTLLRLELKKLVRQTPGKIFTKLV